MKVLNFILNVLFVSLSFIAHSQAFPKNEYLINGIIRGIDSGNIKMLSREGSLLDSAKVEEGKFSFKGKITGPEERIFQIFPGTWSLLTVIEDTVMHFFIDTTGAEHFSDGKHTWALIRKNARIEGGECSRALERFRKEATTFEEQRRWIEVYIHEHSELPASSFLLYTFYTQYKNNLNYKQWQSLLGILSGKALESIFYRKLNEFTEKLKLIQPGSVAPDFTVLQSNKKRFTLSSARGSYVLIDFWASWCVPCRKAIPNWIKLYSKYHSKGFTIVSLSTDSDWSQWIKAINKEKMPWSQVIDKETVADKKRRVSELYEFATIPFYVLLDKEGKIIIASGDEGFIKNKIEKILE